MHSGSYFPLAVSTHSHPKVAALGVHNWSHGIKVSTHSHPKVAANIMMSVSVKREVSTHSHPKVAAYKANKS